MADRKQLLAAAKILIADPTHYRRNPYVYGGSDEDGNFPDPADPEMPIAIRRLGCSYIVVRGKTLRTEMGGGFYHYGFVVIPREKEVGQHKIDDAYVLGRVGKFAFE